MGRRRNLAIFLDVGIFICVIVSLYFLYLYIEFSVLRIVFTLCISLIALATIYFEIKCRSESGKLRKERSPQIRVLVLLGEDERPLKVWELTGKVGVIIGKGSDGYGVDVDLSGTDFAGYIDPEHALLNYHETGWWLLDVSSRNGVEIKRKGRILSLGHDAPVRIEQGDVICIAHYTHIAVG